MDERADEVVVGSWMDSPTKQLLLEAGQAAKVMHPGAVGELLSQELLSWMVFGHRLGSALIMRVAAEVLAENVDQPPVLP
jgi:succinate dehydrogenase/fumarate reductase flavoprotein subunit